MQGHMYVSSKPLPCTQGENRKGSRGELLHFAAFGQRWSFGHPQLSLTSGTAMGRGRPPAPSKKPAANTKPAASKKPACRTKTTVSPKPAGPTSYTKTWLGEHVGPKGGKWVLESIVVNNIRGEMQVVEKWLRMP